MTGTYKGLPVTGPTASGEGRRVAIIASGFNPEIGERLIEGAVSCLRDNLVKDDDISIVWVPGAFELPLVAKTIAESGRVDAVVCLGAVIRGGTPHFEYVAGQAAHGIAQASMQTGIPITFGVLTTDDLEQATARAGGEEGNKGYEAALAALEMANLLEELK
ncbi:MAG TPA: 6,7-dimethyl-8-ribityllumazine synthase [Actinomycetota bacterium]|nr:6,7-dimethyl-8-ribityllumazine synthase [Actinomycetota bacterium]